MAHASITCHLACHNFIAGFRVEYGNSGAGMHRGAFSLRRKRTSPRPSPRASKCRTGLASDPGRVTWGKGCREYVSGQQSDSLQTRPWQRGLALFRPWWSVPYHLKKPDFIRAASAAHVVFAAEEIAAQVGKIERDRAVGGGVADGGARPFPEAHCRTSKQKPRRERVYARP